MDLYTIFMVDMDTIPTMDKKLMNIIIHCVSIDNIEMEAVIHIVDKVMPRSRPEVNYILTTFRILKELHLQLQVFLSMQVTITSHITSAARVGVFHPHAVL
jgi:phospholipid N-methyltransferase